MTEKKDCVFAKIQISLRKLSLEKHHAVGDFCQKMILHQAVDEFIFFQKWPKKCLHVGSNIYIYIYIVYHKQLYDIACAIDNISHSNKPWQ